MSYCFMDLYYNWVSGRADSVSDLKVIVVECEHITCPLILRHISKTITWALDLGLWFRLTM